MSGAILTHRGMVHQWQCDHMGHMNVMWYVGKFDEATWNLGALMGMTSQYIRESGRGMAAVEQRISYQREALVGDMILVRSVVLELKPKSVRFVHEMFRGQDLQGNSGEHLATMMVTGVHIDMKQRKSTQFEPHIFAAAQALLDPQPARWDTWPPKANLG